MQRMRLVSVELGSGRMAWMDNGCGQVGPAARPWSHACVRAGSQPTYYYKAVRLL